MKLLFENKNAIVSISLTILMVFCTLMSGYADENSAPVFIDGGRAVRTIAENTASGRNIGTAIAATDADGDTLTYTLGGTDAAAFRINRTSGQLRTSAALDYETKSSYAVSISTSDTNGGSDSIAVTISVTDVNETPNFPTETTTLSVAENTARGTNIGDPFQATDPDTGDTLTYSLRRGDAGVFRINPNTGQLRTHMALDFETKKVYNNLAIRATDSEGNFDAIFVTINVTDANDAPSFPTETATRTVAENTARGRNIGDPFQATDPDTGDTLTYSLRRGDAGVFRINPTTGQLRTHMALDFEAKKVYNNLAIRATDSEGNFDAIFVTINVTDANDAPNFPTETATRTVAENTASGQDFGEPFQATDPDTGDTVTYSLHRGDARAFRINPSTGQLRTRMALDFETKKVYNDLAIRATDSKGNFDAIFVTINVTDANDAPSFPTETATRTVAENMASGQDFGDPFQATDPDTGDTLTYSLHRGDRGSFRINPSTGQLRTRAALDFETKKVYNDLAIRATDSKGNFDAIFVTINITDANDAPSFPTETATRTVAENTASGQAFGDPFQATDPDNADTLTYSLHRGDARAFRINPSTGQLRTHAALDFETKKVYNNLAIRATDSKGSFDAIFVTINVTDVNENRAPVFSDGTSTTRTIAENTASGQNIGTAVAATDADNDTLTYILGGTDAAMFSIVSTSGQLQTSAALDYETQSSYSVSVSVSDGNGGSDSITVSITVMDVNETPANSAPSFTDGSSATRSVAENTTAGTNIGIAVAATDVDNDTLTYTLGGRDAASFRIVSTSGQLQTKAALNHEADTSYAVTVSVSDDKGGTDSIAITINVTDVNEKPSFGISGRVTLSVAEHRVSGTNIGAPFQATDPDSGDTLTYSLQRGDKDAFRIDARTGQLQTHAPLDYETKRTYNDLAVRATDSQGLINSVLVTINVTDVTEVTAIEPPLSERTPQVRDGIVAAAGANSVGDVTATHLAAITSLDLSNKSISSLKAGDFSGLTSLTTLDLEGNSLSDISALEDLTALTTLKLSYNYSISDISALEDLTALTRLELNSNLISDLSVLSNLTALTRLSLVYNRISDISALEDLTALTTLDLTGNSLSDISALEDLTALNSLTLGWNRKISDISALENLTALTTLDLLNNRISDISVLSNLTALKSLFLGGNSISDISVLEDLTSLKALSLGGNSISDISVLSNLTALEWLFLGGNSISDISVLSNLTALTLLDLENNPIPDYGPLRTLKAANPDVEIDIDIDNNPPVFTEGTSTTRSVAENTAAGTNIGAPVSATDADQDLLRYYLGGTDASSFSIGLTSGQLQTKAALDYEKKSSYSVTVDVKDGVKGYGLDRITVTIDVTDVVENVGAAPSVETAPVIPDNTALLTNFPNPFNPETWIPYQLAEPAAVTITIYDVRGRVVRTLLLGNQPAGFYQSRSKAAHWDGRNYLGEQVATGIYFYTLKAGDYMATRKLLIRK